MAAKKKANKFLTDIDLCNNQIKNGTWEHWTETVLPTENLFDGRSLFLEKDIPTIIEGKSYTYEAGSVIICHKGTGGDFVFLKQLSSLQTEDVSGAIKELWRSKSGLFYGEFATKALLDAADATKWELDLAIVNADETHDGKSTLYKAVKTGSTDPQGAVADHWVYAATIGKDWSGEISKKIDLVDEATETGGKACFAPFGMTPDFSDPEMVTVKVDKVRLSKNPGPGYSRVDSIDIPVPRAVIHEIVGGVEVNTAGLYTKGLADKKVDVDQGTANKYKVLAVGEDGKVKPSDISGYITYEGRDGVKTEPKSSTDPSQGTWIETDWDKVAHYPGKATATEEYNLPYHIETPVQNADNIAAKFYTVALNKDNTKKDFTISIPKADIANDKAGLYTKAMNDALVTAIGNEKTRAEGAESTLTTNLAAEVSRATAAEALKADKTYVDDGLATKVGKFGKVPGTDQPYRLPYFFSTTPTENKITVTAKTVGMDDHSVVGDYTLDVPAATQTEIGLMLAADKKKLDELGVTTDETSTTNPLSAKYTMDKIKEYGATFRGSFTHYGTRVQSSDTLLTEYAGEADVNDYAIVLDDETRGKECSRYIFQGKTAEGKYIWAFEYAIINVPLTKDQWTTINSKLYDGSQTGSPSISGGIDVSKKMDKLPLETYSGEEYKFPFHIEEPVQNTDTITAKFHTLEINNGTERAEHTVTIPLADVSATKAGLYNKTIDDTLVHNSEMVAMTNDEVDALTSGW